MNLLKKIFSSFLIITFLFHLFPFSQVFAGPTTTVPGITITKLFDGTAPFDISVGNGNDTGANNGIVRAGQITAYKFDLSLNDPNAGTPTPYNNFTFISDPLLLGFRWQSLPVFCSGSGSNISGDGITTQSVLTCNTGTKNTGDVFSVNASVFTLPTVVNNTTLSFGATTSVTGTSNTSSATAPQVSATSLPKIDIQKSGAQFFASKNVNGVDGYVYAHGLGIKLKPGSEIPELPLTFTDDISAINPNAKFIGCGVSGTQASALNNAWVYATSMPLGKTGQYSAWDNNATNSVKDSGTISCTPQSGSGQIVDISIDNIDMLSPVLPTTLFAPSYGAVSPGDNWIGSYYTLIWIPATEFNSSNSYNFIGTNKYNNFDPVGDISGAPNYNNVTLEPGRGLDNNATASNTAITGTENWYTQIYYRPGPGSFDKADYRFSDAISTATFYGDTTDGSIRGGHIGSTYRSGDGVMANNGRYTSLMVNYYNGVIDIPAGFISCSTINTSKVSIEALPGHPTRGAFNFAYGPQEANNAAAIAVEYGIGGQGGTGTGWTDTDEMKTATCEDTDSTGGIWYDDITTVPGGKENITKVRFRVTDTWTVAEQLALMASTGVGNVYSYGAVLLKVKSSATPGTIAPNYGKWKDPSGNWFAGWIQPAYDVSTGLGSYGDRITVVGTRVRVAKTVNDALTESASGLAGSIKSFYLTPTSDSLGVNPPGESVNVRITDTLPVGLNYTLGTATCLDASPAVQPVSCEPSVTINGDGTTTLTWNYGTFTAGSVMTKLKFDTTLDTTLANGASLVNSAIISADNDNSLPAWRTDTATAIVVNPSAFAIQKKVLTPFVPIGDPISYKIIAKNTGSDTVNTTDFIDWLPWNGDSRTPISSFSGQIQFTSLTHTSGVVPSEVLYTKYNPTSLSLPNDLDPDTVNPAIIWCSSLSGGTCPANNSEVTGFRVKTNAMTSGQGTEFTLVITPSPTALDTTGNIFTNRFKGRVEGLTLPIESNNVFATVVSGTIGDTVYWDKSGNGLQDIGELGIAGVTVVLLYSDNSPVDCDFSTSGVQACIAVTDTDGKYVFKDLLFGDYKVKVTPPVGYTQSADPDSTLDNESIITVSNTSAPSRINLTGDFGYKGTATWGNRVWLDTNSNGVQDSGEINIDTAEINGLEFAGFDGIFGTSDDVTYPSTQTQNLVIGDNFGGNYLYSHLPPGNYRSSVNPVISSITGALLTTTGSTLYTLSPSEQYSAADYGFALPFSIGDMFWYDLNADGIQDIGEPGIAGVKLNLKDSIGNIIGTAITDVNGNYKFTNEASIGNTSIAGGLLLIPGTNYTISIDPTSFAGGGVLDSLSGYVATASQIGNQSMDSNYDGVNKASFPFTLPTVQEILAGNNKDLTIDFGVKKDFDLTLKKYIDNNDAQDVLTAITQGYNSTFNYIIRVSNLGSGQTNGITTITDTLPIGIEMTALPSGTGWSCTQSGSQIFSCNIATSILAGTMFPDMSIPVKVTATDAILTNTASVYNSNEVSTAHSLGDPTTNNPSHPTGANNSDPAVSQVIPVTIGNTIWNDLNKNGIQDIGEPGISGISISLLDDAGNIIGTATTNTSGVYTFSSELGTSSTDGSLQKNLPIIPGANYTLRVNTSNFTSIPWIATQSGQGNITNDSNGLISTTGGDIKQNGISSTTFQAPTTSSKIDIDLDFGFYQDFDIRVKQYINTIHPNNDANTSASGITDINSFGYKDTFNIILQVSNAGTGQTIGMTTLTEIIPEGLIVNTGSLIVPTGWDYVINGQKITFTSTNVVLAGQSYPTISIPVIVNTTDSIDLKFDASLSNPNEISTAHDLTNTSNPTSPNLLTPEGRNNVDPVLISIFPIKIGNKIWNDEDRDGTQDSTELGISGIPLELIDGSGAVIASLTTDANGEYIFSSEKGTSTLGFTKNLSLIPNTTGYTIRIPSNTFTLGSLLGFTISPFGLGDSHTDSHLKNDGNGIYMTIVRLPTKGNLDFSYDGGVYKFSSSKGSGSSGSKSPSTPPVTSISPIIPTNPVAEVKVPTTTNISDVSAVPLKDKITLQSLKEKYDTLISATFEKYKKLEKLAQVLDVQTDTSIVGESLLFILPKELPRTGTPISERIETKKNPKVDTSLPDASVFRLAGDTNNEISHWTQVLVEEDRNAYKYIVIPSNGLVVPINEFASDSTDFQTMISGREGNINPVLDTGALEYPGTSTKGYGEVGNKVVFGHSSFWESNKGRYKTHFQKIIELDTGEEVWIYEKKEDGTYAQYKYKTEKSYNTPASDVSVLLPGEGKNLTLFTCTPIGGIAGRWIIQAKYIEEKKEVQNTSDEKLPSVSQKYKLNIGRMLEKIQAIEDSEKRLKILYLVYERVHILIEKNQQKKQVKNILEYIQYQLAKNILQ